MRFFQAANKDEQTPLSVANEALAAALKKAAQRAMDVDGQKIEAGHV